MLPESLNKEIKSLGEESQQVIKNIIGFYQSKIKELENLSARFKKQRFETHINSLSTTDEASGNQYSPLGIKVSIVEDDLEFQKWILEELTSSSVIKCISQHTTGEDLLAQIPVLQPDIVLVDLTLHGSKYDGIETMLRIKVHYPTINCLVISDHNTENKIFEALRVGAGAYLHKGDIPQRLADLIHQFFLGAAPMSPGIAKRVLRSFHKSADDLQLLDKLTPRQEEILEYISNGFLNKEIADKLGLTEGAIKQHLNKIYNKLQVNNRIEAIRKYL